MKKLILLIMMVVYFDFAYADIDHLYFHYCLYTRIQTTQSSSYTFATGTLFDVELEDKSHDRITITMPSGARGLYCDDGDDSHAAVFSGFNRRSGAVSFAIIGEPGTEFSGVGGAGTIDVDTAYTSYKFTVHYRTHNFFICTHKVLCAGFDQDDDHDYTIPTEGITSYYVILKLN